MGRNKLVLKQLPKKKKIFIIPAVLRQSVKECRTLALEQHSYEKTSQLWRDVSDTVSDLISPTAELWTRAPIAMSFTITPTRQLTTYYRHIYFQSGRVFVTGQAVDALSISGRFHNTNDLIATVLAVEPTRFIYKSRFVLKCVCFVLQVLSRVLIISIFEVVKPCV